MSFLIKKETIHKYIFFILFLCVAILIATRNSYLISDGPNYIEHAYMDVKFNNIEFYSSSGYWSIVYFFGKYFGDYFPNFLSFISSMIICFSSLRLRYKRRYLLLLLFVLNPIIFNTMQVALRNGFGLSLVIFALAYNSRISNLLAASVHPGTIPISLTLLLVDNFKFTWKSISFLVITLLVSLFLYVEFFQSISEVRGYSSDDQNLAGIFTYIFFFFLSVSYWLSLKNTRYRYFLPIMYVVWVLLGFKYAFAPRVFVQAVPVSLFIFLLYYKGNTLFGKVFILLFTFLSCYLAYQWHPMYEYADGWIGYWIQLSQF